jgi:hypothetical protein
VPKRVLGQTICLPELNGFDGLHAVDDEAGQDQHQHANEKGDEVD